MCLAVGMGLLGKIWEFGILGNPQMGTACIRGSFPGEKMYSMTSCSRLQLRILQRAMKMLKDDGKIVYSTCSLNPVEKRGPSSLPLSNRTMVIVTHRIHSFFIDAFCQILNWWMSQLNYQSLSGGQG
jgi:hypothetical protein